MINVKDPELLSLASGAVDAVLSRVSRQNCSVLLLTDGTTSSTTVLRVGHSDLVAPWGVGVFEVAVDGQDANVTQAQLSWVVDKARRLRQVSWCVTMVVVSDDPAFLAAFAEWSLKGRLLVWSTRLLAVTRLSLPELHHLHKLLSMTNSMLLIVENNSRPIRCSIIIKLPFLQHDTQLMQVASWTQQQDLKFGGHLPLFPEKFSK
ncbi:putative olfactory ionotropic receptor IR4-like 12 [Homarus americanus]|uniref:Putative olfactory ionotropic receptor IR4-like 12 n=1 Tax=Homarus americanus TaxID=6706 RepID=A0A8J5MSE7_HOMAM|nr:putative olfactory ionotropic receptor IR4-like 12 [Homarus americanus]